MANNADYINDIQQLLPTVFIEQVILEPANISQEQKLSSMRAVMSIKDVVEKDGISQWFVDQDLTNFMKLRILVFKSESLYKTILNFTSTENYSVFEIDSIVQQNKKDVQGYFFPLPDKKTLESQMGAFYSENYITVNDDGTKEITVPINANFRFLFDDEKDSFLAIIAFMTFNLSDFANQFGITDITETEALSKSLTPMIVIKDGSVVSQFQYFILPDGQFYYGQYHTNTKTDGTIEYKTGTVETETSQELQLVTDIHNIVSDMRARRFVSEKNKDTIFFTSDPNIIDETTLINNLTKTNFQIEKILKKSKPTSYFKYFSEPIISLDDKGNCRFSFFFDKQKFILENSFYPVVLDPTKNTETISKKVRIKNISVYRIRKDIKEINYNSENNAVLVASNSTSENEYDILNQPDIGKYEGSYIVENNIEGVDPNVIKTYSVYDSKIQNINYGLYKYKVMIDVVDPTKQYIIDTLSKFTSKDGVLSSLKKYYDAAISNKKESTEQVEGDIKFTKAKYTPYFDNLLGKFIPSFLKDKLLETQVAQIALLVFLNTAKEFGYYSFTDTDKEKKFILDMNSFLVPPTASPNTILLLIEIVNNFVEKLQYLIDLSDTEKKSSPSGKGNLLSFEYIMEPSFVDRLGNSIDYKIDTSYENYFNAAIMNGVGFKLIDNLTNNNDGLNSIALLDYKKITDSISQKHFNDYTSLNMREIYGETVQDIYDFTDNFDDDDSKYSFLPVSSIRTIGNKYSFGKLSEQLFNQKFFENIFLDILNYNTLKQTSFGSQDIPLNSSLPKEDLVIKSQLLDLFGFESFSNVSIATQKPTTSFQKNIKDSLFNVFGKSGVADVDTKIDKQVTQNLASTITSTSEQNQNPASLLIEILLHEIVATTEQLTKARDFTMFSPVNEQGEKNPRFFMDKIVALAFITSLIPGSKDLKTIIEEYFRGLPIPIKHLIVSRGQLLKMSKAFEDENFEKDASKYPENFFKFWINFKNLYEIQYFDGLDKNNVKLPVWKTLTISKLQNSTSKILCRIQKYKLPSFEEYFPDIRKLEMPIFDKYFYIIPDNSVDLLVSIEKSVKAAASYELPPVQKRNAAPDRAGPISFRDPQDLPTRTGTQEQETTRAAAPTPRVITKRTISEVSKERIIPSSTESASRAGTQSSKGRAIEQSRTTKNTRDVKFSR